MAYFIGVFLMIRASEELVKEKITQSVLGVIKIKLHYKMCCFQLHSNFRECFTSAETDAIECVCYGPFICTKRDCTTAVS